MCRRVSFRCPDSMQVFPVYPHQSDEMDGPLSESSVLELFWEHGVLLASFRGSLGWRL